MSGDVDTTRLRRVGTINHVPDDQILEAGWDAVAELPTTSATKPWEELEGRDKHAACMVAARDGDRAAFDVLVAELTPLVWHVARSSGLDRTTAEDVVQTVWLALLRHIDRLAEPRALGAWLITTTRREAIRTRQRGSGQVELTTEEAERLPTAEPSPEHQVLDQERDRHLWTVFYQLSQRCQELLRLTVLAGRAEYRAVAEAMHMPHGSIGPTRGRCLNSLRSLYNGDSGS